MKRLKMQLGALGGGPRGPNLVRGRGAQGRSRAGQGDSAWVSARRGALLAWPSLCRSASIGTVSWPLAAAQAVPNMSRAATPATFKRAPKGWWLALQRS